VHSTVRKSFQGDPDTKKHLCLGIRGYYENVTGLHPENFIELIFLKRLLPGYFWIFPTAGGLVNAGFGMMHSAIRKQRENMVHILHDIITNDPLIAPRFKNATPAGKPAAHQLPLGTRRMGYSGDRYLLTGDAAFLVDPFSGEGIGNAMASGEIASRVLEKCFSADNFSAAALSDYDVRIRQRFGQEFRIMSGMQRLAGSSALVNMVINKAGRNRELNALLTRMFTSMDVRKSLTRPGFYAGLLFK
jgi:flavin-dependent dehydrogenase